MCKEIDMNTQLQRINDASKESSKLRVQQAYQEWLITKTHIKKTALIFKTDPSKLKQYILQQGHVLKTFNDEIFENIDTEEKAYWLGFLYADGYLDETRSALELSLQLSDKEHLDKFYKFVNCTREVKLDTYRCRTSLTSKKLAKSLVKHGCTQKKSFTITFPKISTSLLRHFVRGYFDGDGTITFGSKNDLKYSSASLCSGSSDFIEEVVSVFNTQTGSKCKQKGHKSKSSTLYIVTLKSNLCVTFLNWLYKDATVYMNRKYNRYQNSIAV